MPSPTYYVCGCKKHFLMRSGFGHTRPMQKCRQGVTEFRGMHGKKPLHVCISSLTLRPYLAMQKNIPPFFVSLGHFSVPCTPHGRARGGRARGTCGQSRHSRRERGEKLLAGPRVEEGNFPGSREASFREISRPIPGILEHPFSRRPRSLGPPQ